MDFRVLRILTAIGALLDAVFRTDPNHPTFQSEAIQVKAATIPLM